MGKFIDGAKAKNATAIALKEMNLHETIDLGRVHILRVWAGWIYWSFESAKVVAAVFVPQGTLSDEQQQLLDDEEREKPPRPRKLTEEQTAEARKLAEIELEKKG